MKVQVLAQLKSCPTEDNPGAAGLEADLLCRLMKENPVLKRIEVSCRPRLAGSITLKRYGAGEVSSAPSWCSLLAVGQSCVCVTRATRACGGVSSGDQHDDVLCLEKQAGRYRGGGLRRQPVYHPRGPPRARCSGDDHMYIVNQRREIGYIVHHGPTVSVIGTLRTKP